MNPEKFNHQEYRDNLVKDLKDLRAEGPEGKEDAEFLLDGVGGTSEYREAEKIHHKEIQEFLGEKATAEKIKLRQERVEKMKEIVEGLPLKYIAVPGKKNAVLLKADGTDAAFLVGDALVKRGSSYSMHAGGENIYFICGCGSNACGHFKEDFVTSLVETAKKENISQIISRQAGISMRDGIKFVDIENVYREKEHTSPIGDIFRTINEPGMKQAEEIRLKEQEERNKQIDEESKKHQEAYKKRIEEEAKILEEASFLEDGVIAGDDEATKKLEEITSKLTPEINWSVEVNIHKRLKNVEEVTSKLPSSVNVLCISRHNEKESVFHLPTSKKQIEFSNDTEGNFVFEYPDGSQTKKYRVVGARPGLDQKVAVVESTPVEIMEYRGREDETLELYTDLPFYETFANRVESAILSKTRGFDKYKFTQKEIEDKVTNDMYNSRVFMNKS